MLRVARIPYLNSAPFYRTVAAQVDLLDLPPRQLGVAAREGAVDAGILSMCDIFRIPGLTSLGDLGVAVSGPSHSVLLFTRERPEMLAGGTVGVTSETSTSFPLLRLLLAELLRVPEVTYERRLAPASQAGQLLIGDDALRAAAVGGLLPGRDAYGSDPIPLAESSEQPWRWALDLGAAWCAWQSMPFVFAEWVVRDSVESARREELAGTLHDSLDWSEANLGAVALASEGMAGLDAAAAEAYLRGFTYRLGRSERRAIEVFREMIENSPWWQTEAMMTRQGT